MGFPSSWNVEDRTLEAGNVLGYYTQEIQRYVCRALRISERHDVN